MVISALKILVAMIMISLLSILQANEDYFNDSITSDWVFQTKDFEYEIPPDLIAAIKNNVALTFCVTLKIAKKLGPFFFLCIKKLNALLSAVMQLEKILF